MDTAITEDDDVKILIQDNGTIDTIFHTGKKMSRSNKLVKTRYCLVDVGISNFSSPATYRLDDGTDPFELRTLKSLNINWHLVQQRLSMARGYLNLQYGLTLEYHRYFFQNPVILKDRTPNVEFEHTPEISYKKNRLRYTYLTVPLMVNIKSNPNRSSKSLHISAGGFAGIFVGANFKTKANGNKSKYRDDFNLNKFRYGLRAEFGYGPLIFYGTYNLNELFEENKNNGYEINPFAVGVVVWPF